MYVQGVEEVDVAEEAEGVEEVEGPAEVPEAVAIAAGVRLVEVVVGVALVEVVAGIAVVAVPLDVVEVMPFGDPVVEVVAVGIPEKSVRYIKKRGRE